MLNSSIKDKIDSIQGHISDINLLLCDLRADNVEIKIEFTKDTTTQDPILKLWRAIEHVDYLKSTEDDAE